MLRCRNEKKISQEQFNRNTKTLRIYLALFFTFYGLIMLIVLPSTKSYFNKIENKLVLQCIHVYQNL